MIPVLRLATEQDADYLFALRNDPVTQACSRSTAAISRSDHQNWMKLNVAIGYPEHRVAIAESDIGRLGVVRFDASKSDLMTFNVGITLAPQHRGKGFSHDVLREACNYMSDFKLHAEVRRENTASRKLFERCGFEEIGRDDGFINFVKEPVA